MAGAGEFIRSRIELRDEKSRSRAYCRRTAISLLASVLKPPLSRGGSFPVPPAERATNQLNESGSLRPPLESHGNRRMHLPRWQQVSMEPNGPYSFPTKSAAKWLSNDGAARHAVDGELHE